MSAPFRSIDSRSELLENLRQRTPSTLLGAEDEAPREFFLGVVQSCAIGICSEGHGLKPSLFVDESREEAWVGYNRKVANVDLCTCRTRFVVKLDSVFYAITSQMPDGSVVVVHELGACRINRAGELLWSHSSDIVVDFVDSDKDLRLHTDESEVVIEKATGVAV